MNRRAPRPYSTLRDGKIVWVYAGENAPVKKRRSRPETDDEVRARIDAEIKRRRQANPYWIWLPYAGSARPRPVDLEADLRVLGLPPRQIIEEDV